MFRTITRILMIVVACAALVALALVAKAEATGANPVAWLASDSGPLAPASSLGSAGPTTTPQAASNVGDADSDGDSGMETSAAESAQDTDQQSEQELSGVVASVDSASSMFTLTTTSGAVTVRVTGATQYEGGLSGLASLRSGMSVTVKGTAQGAGQTLADEIKGSSDTGATDGADTNSPDSGH